MYWDDKYGTQSVSSDVSRRHSKSFEWFVSYQSSPKISHPWSSLTAGHFKYESHDDWGLEQCYQQLLPIGWWLQVIDLWPLHASDITHIFIRLHINIIYEQKKLCSIPFSVDDISKSMDQIEATDVDPPPLIRENSGFAFLLQGSSDWTFLASSFLSHFGMKLTSLHIEASRILLANI